MKMIAGVEVGLNVTWSLWIPRDCVKIDHSVKFLAFTDPLVDRLTRLLFVWIVKIVERRIHDLEGVLERRQRHPDNANVARVGLGDQLPVARNQVVYGNWRIVG